MLHMMNKIWRFKRTTLITVLCGGLLGGLWLSRIEVSVASGWLAVLAAFSAVTWRRRSLVTCFALLLLGLGLGIARGNQFAGHLYPYAGLMGQKVTVHATVHSDTEYSNLGQLRFDADAVHIVSPRRHDLPGKIDVQGRGENALYRGDRVEITGTLRPARGSRQARLTFAELKVLNRNKSVLEKMRREFVSGITTALPEPSATFGLGLLMGYRTSLPEATEEALNIAGLTHIIAVSGYNLTIIIRAVRRALKKRSKYQQTVVSLFLIASFLLITDFSASIVRASLVSGLSLAAWYYGRQFKPLLLITLVAAITALWRPIYLWADIGWYLSFLAFSGILLVAPLCMRLVRERLGREPSQLTYILVETAAAQILTAPLILYIFNRVSLIGILSNLIIGPLVPVVMVLVLIAGIAGMFTPLLAGYLAWPARIALRFILSLVHYFSHVPYAMVAGSISLAGMLGAYMVIVLTVIIVSKTKGATYSKITDINSII